MKTNRVIFTNDYSSETLPELMEDVEIALYRENLPVDEHGFTAGTFKVIIEWHPD